MSSLSSRFSTRVLPSDRAARSRHRFERDLEPGKVTVPSREVMGVTVRRFADSSSSNDLAPRVTEVRGDCRCCMVKDVTGKRVNSSEAAAAMVLLIVDGVLWRMGCSPSWWCGVGRTRSSTWKASVDRQ